MTVRKSNQLQQGDEVFTKYDAWSMHPGEWHPHHTVKIGQREKFVKNFSYTHLDPVTFVPERRCEDVILRQYLLATPSGELIAAPVVVSLGE